MHLMNSIIDNSINPQSLPYLTMMIISQQVGVLSALIIILTLPASDQFFSYLRDHVSSGFRDHFHPSSLPLPAHQHEDDSLAGIVLMHGLGIPLGPDKICEKFLKSQLKGLGLSDKTFVRCPVASREPVGVIPATFVPGMQFVRSWFNFWMMPALSVVSPLPGESKEDLEKCLRIVEGEIEELMSLGVPSKNIVVGGLSQGGVITLYTAMHTKYELGGFLPIVTWLPLLKKEPPSNLAVPPVNQHTPILQVNGMMDLMVPVIPAGKMTEREMLKVYIGLIK